MALICAAEGKPGCWYRTTRGIRFQLLRLDGGNAIIRTESGRDTELDGSTMIEAAEEQVAEDPAAYRVAVEAITAKDWTKLPLLLRDLDGDQLSALASRYAVLPVIQAVTGERRRRKDGAEVAPAAPPAGDLITRCAVCAADVTARRSVAAGGYVVATHAGPDSPVCPGSGRTTAIEPDPGLPSGWETANGDGRLELIKTIGTAERLDLVAAWVAEHGGAVRYTREIDRQREHLAAFEAAVSKARDGDAEALAWLAGGMAGRVLETRPGVARRYADEATWAKKVIEGMKRADAEAGDKARAAAEVEAAKAKAADRAEARVEGARSHLGEAPLFAAELLAGAWREAAGPHTPPDDLADVVGVFLAGVRPARERAPHEDRVDVLRTAYRVESAGAARPTILTILEKRLRALGAKVYLPAEDVPPEVQAWWDLSADEAISEIASATGLERLAHLRELEVGGTRAPCRASVLDAVDRRQRELARAALDSDQVLEEHLSALEPADAARRIAVHPNARMFFASYVADLTDEAAVDLCKAIVGCPEASDDLKGEARQVGRYRMPDIAPPPPAAPPPATERTDDELLASLEDLVEKSRPKGVSTQTICRVLKIGYTRAAALVDAYQAKHGVKPADPPPLRSQVDAAAKALVAGAISAEITVPDEPVEIGDLPAADQVARASLGRALELIDGLSLDEVAAAEAAEAAREGGPRGKVVAELEERRRDLQARTAPPGDSATGVDSPGVDTDPAPEAPVEPVDAPAAEAPAPTPPEPSDAPVAPASKPERKPRGIPATAMQRALQRVRELPPGSLLRFVPLPDGGEDLWAQRPDGEQLRIGLVADLLQLPEGQAFVGRLRAEQLQAEALRDAMRRSPPPAIEAGPSDVDLLRAALANLADALPAAKRLGVRLTLSIDTEATR